jgi:hypothetical protein
MIKQLYHILDHPITPPRQHLQFSTSILFQLKAVTADAAYPSVKRSGSKLYMCALTRLTSPRVVNFGLDPQTKMERSMALWKRSCLSR